jgi:hypothetical protein
VGASGRASDPHSVVVRNARGIRHRSTTDRWEAGIRRRGSGADGLLQVPIRERLDETLEGVEMLELFDDLRVDDIGVAVH